ELEADAQAIAGGERLAGREHVEAGTVFGLAGIAFHGPVNLPPVTPAGERDLAQRVVCAVQERVLALRVQPAAIGLDREIDVGGLELGARSIAPCEHVLGPVVAVGLARGSTLAAAL